MLDVSGHRQARRERAADAGRATRRRGCSRAGEPARLSPMNPFERKVVHDAIADDRRRASASPRARSRTAGWSCSSTGERRRAERPGRARAGLTAQAPVPAAGRRRRRAGCSAPRLDLAERYAGRAGRRPASCAACSARARSRGCGSGTCSTRPSLTDLLPLGARVVDVGSRGRAARSRAGPPPTRSAGRPRRADAAPDDFLAEAVDRARAWAIRYGWSAAGPRTAADRGASWVEPMGRRPRGRAAGPAGGMVSAAAGARWAAAGPEGRRRTETRSREHRVRRVRRDRESAHVELARACTGRRCSDEPTRVVVVTRSTATGTSGKPGWPDA